MAGTAARQPNQTPFRLTSSHPLPRLGGRIEDAAVVVREDPCVVEEDVESAVRVHGAADHGPDLGFVRDVHGEGRGGTPGGHDLDGRGLGLFGDHVGHHDPGPFVGEDRGRHPTDPAPGSGDHRHLVVEPSHCFLLLFGSDCRPSGVALARRIDRDGSVRTLSVGRSPGGRDPATGRRSVGTVIPSRRSGPGGVGTDLPCGQPGQRRTVVEWTGPTFS